MLRAGARWVARAALVAALLLLALLAIGPHAGWFQGLTVLSGSMRPTFDAGDIVVATPARVSDLRSGDIIVYLAPPPNSAVVSHRIVSVRPDGDSVLVQTRGDANPVADPWTARLPAGTAWRVRYVVPRLGRVLNWLQHGPLRPVILFGCPVLLALCLLVWIWRPAPRKRPAPGKQPTPTARREPAWLRADPPRSAQPAWGEVRDRKPDRPRFVSLDELLEGPGGQVDAGHGVEPVGVYDDPVLGLDPPVERDLHLGV